MLQPVPRVPARGNTARVDEGRRDVGEADSSHTRALKCEGTAHNAKCVDVARRCGVEGGRTWQHELSCDVVHRDVLLALGVSRCSGA